MPACTAISIGQRTTFGPRVASRRPESGKRSSARRQTSGRYQSVSPGAIRFYATISADIYLYARRLGLKVMLFTNARLITPELANLLARVPPLKKVEVSAYGMRPESYDSVACVPGAFTEFRRGVELLLERQVPLVIKSVLLPPNRNEMDEFEAWAASLPGMDRPPVYSMFLDLRARRDSPAKNQRIAALRLTPMEGLALLTRDEGTYLHAMAQMAAQFMGPQEDRTLRLRCGGGGAAWMPMVCTRCACCCGTPNNGLRPEARDSSPCAD